MKLKDVLRLNVDCMAVRWIDYDGIGKFINNQDIWLNDDINELFTEEQLSKEIEYITTVDGDLIVMLKEEVNNV